ncbi:chromosome segregation protein SMC [Caproiciproducens galactitolivorans]|uniref:Chromosome partition protein Smc n=1 Tax=Caproiciproducens galactitolivorans TaxID=642589 RepID=A0A4Z0Y251_9FIRM|nr:chromosome segregation protein SMC [Caproiciproducens galactitolivorans]QEY34232.1 chromosome segregation protein SMC [Caproiciproducens galactitolivorans]TGJ78009.1 chromosome partition protein Smc [Caproiciproducens galactitolivorans]
MLLKSLEIQGFKTFPDKTTLSFDKGITVVVGPNGSGKSNISDAVRWVFGEQSTRVLRCTKMEDVIFNGTPTRKAQGFAEVTLNIDNTLRQLPFDGDSVAITRRYYRSGDSEYLINKAAVRLKDINELFMDTGLGCDGYSIIGQGKIDSIVAARSEDRREIFEEAAGISRFRYRKEESERKLNQAQENLLRLNDILSELESRVGPLKEQAEKAEQYLEWAGEKRTLEIGLWLNTLKKFGQILREHEDKILIARNQHETSEQELDDIDRQIEENYRKSGECTARMDEIRQQAAQLEESAAKKDGEASVLQNDILHHNENIERIRREIEQSNLSGQDMDRDILEKNRHIEEKSQYINDQAAQAKKFEEQIEQIRKDMSETAEKIDDYTRQIAKLTAQATEAKVAKMTAVSSIAEIQLRISQIAESVRSKKLQTEKLQNAEKEAKKKLAEADERIHALSNSVKGYEMRLATRRKRMEDLKKQSDALYLDAQEHSRRAHLLEELERNLEGFSQSVKVIMKGARRGTISGIHGPVSRLIKVPHQYAVAIETALGAAMQNIVVGNEQDAKRAIQLLKQRDSGRATFLPLSTIRGRELQETGLEECPGYIGTAVSLCGCDEKYKDILNSLLGRIAVAEDLDSAVAMAKRYGYRFRIVTLDGQVVNAGGSLTGGSLVKNAGLLSRASEIERMKAQAAELQAKAQEAAAALKSATEEVSAAEASLSASKGELATAQEERFKMDAERGRTAADLTAVRNDLLALQEEEKAATLRLNGQREAQTDAQAREEEISRKQAFLQAELDKISGSRSGLNRTVDELNARLQEIRMACLSAEKDVESLRAAIADIERRKLDHAGREQSLKEEIKAAQEECVKLRGQIESLRQEAQNMRETAKKCSGQIEELNAKRMEYERLSVELRAKEHEKSAEKEKIGHELARLEERKENLQKEYDEIISRLWEEYELTRREAEEVGAKIENPLQAQKRLNELKSKIKALGTVNLAAVEEYKEVSERYEFMKAQVADVEKSREELKKLIGDLTHQMHELFLSRFKQINENFKSTFRELFGGGNAELSLCDPEDILNSGIDISVQPPGKIITHLESLSGGEKALVAIALYFAIMKVKPPPFCVLDEIEAALDDVNVNRFAAYLRRMTKNTQFIAITHRRGTMEEADVLYGVTMQDEGISKLLELRISEIEAKLGMKE